MGCCNNAENEGVHMEKKNSRQIVSSMRAEKKITEKEAWEQVNNLWEKHNLKKEDPLTLDLARPFIESYIKSVKKVNSIDDGLVL